MINDMRYACGGHVNNSDPNAPKEIISKKLICFETGFYAKAYNNPMGSAAFSFTVKRDSENAPLILAYDGKMIETDETFLDAIQAFIDRDGMAKMNGNYEFTYGVPPECQGYRITAVYESGEKIDFNTMGGPYLQWCNDLYKVLCNELVRHGIEDLLPPLADRTVVRFDLKFHEWPRDIHYCTIRMQDDAPDKNPVHYMKGIWNKETKSSECSQIVTIPEGFYEHITELVEQTGLRDFSNGQIDFYGDYKYDTCEEPVIGFCCQGESGKQFNAFLIGKDIPEGLAEAVEPIKAYLETLFIKP